MKHNRKFFIRLALLLVGIGLCLWLVFADGKKQGEAFVPRPPFKTKQECYEAADRYTQKCLAEGNHRFFCIAEIYCDDRGCC